MSSVDVGGQTILGCPVSSFLSLESACSITNLPPCATATSANYDAACCGSLTSYGLSLFSCFEQHAPTCLDTSAVAASITGGPSGTNPCAAYATPGGGSGGGSSGAPTTSAAVLTSAGSSAAAGTGSAASGAASAGSTGSPAGSSTSASATAKNNAPRVGAGLKVYIGVALVGALAVLAM